MIFESGVLQVLPDVRLEPPAVTGPLLHASAAQYRSDDSKGGAGLLLRHPTYLAY